MKSRQQTLVRAVIRRHAARICYVLVFAFMWGPAVVLAAVVGVDFLDTGAEVTST